MQKINTRVIYKKKCFRFQTLWNTTFDLLSQGALFFKLDKLLTF